MDSKNVMAGLTTYGLISENMKEKVACTEPVFRKSLSLVRREPISVFMESGPSTIAHVDANRMHGKFEMLNAIARELDERAANRELVERAAYGVAWVPGYIWQNLGSGTACSEMRQTVEDTNISIRSSNFEISDTDVGWERN